MRSNFTRILSFAAMACLAAAAFVAGTGVAIAATARRVWDAVTAWVSPPEAIHSKSPDQTRAGVALVTARAYVQRMLRRNRPDVTPGWRMCPSI